jgi:hypothetical protein
MEQKFGLNERGDASALVLKAQPRTHSISLQRTSVGPCAHSLGTWRRFAATPGYPPVPSPLKPNFLTFSRHNPLKLNLLAHNHVSRFWLHWLR